MEEPENLSAGAGNLTIFTTNKIVLTTFDRDLRCDMSKSSPR